MKRLLTGALALSLLTSTAATAKPDHGDRDHGKDQGGYSEDRDHGYDRGDKYDKHDKHDDRGDSDRDHDNGDRHGHKDKRD